MTDYDTLSAYFTAQWNVGVIAKPTIYNKDIQYSLDYPMTLFFKMYDKMPMRTLASYGVTEALVVRRQQFKIYGVYSTYANAEKGLKESKRIITIGPKLFIAGMGKINETQLRFEFELPCYEKKYLQKSDW